jgi:hypothetical protein
MRSGMKSNTATTLLGPIAAHSAVFCTAVSRQFSVLKNSRALDLFKSPSERPFQDLAAPLSRDHAAELFRVCKSVAIPIL